MGYSGKLAVFFCLFLLTSAEVQAANFVVTRTDDPTPSPAPNGCDTGGSCSLREAVLASNANNANDTIVLEATAAPYSLTRQGAPEEIGHTGDLDIMDSDNTITISGADADTTIIDATGLSDRIFDVHEINQTVTMNNLTLQNGDAEAENGGAIRVSGDGMSGSNLLHMNDCRLLDNEAANGGAIWGQNAGADGLILLRSLLTGNSASGNGGGIAASSGFGANILDSTIDDNDAGADGGGIWVLSNTFPDLRNSTVSNNTAGGMGGGIFFEGVGDINLNNSTISGNHATNGGAIKAGSISGVKFRNVTITDNSSSGAGAGIFIPLNQGVNDATFSNSILAGNSTDSDTPDDCSADGFLFNSGDSSYNVFGAVADCLIPLGPGNVTDVSNPGLGPLANNGGLTLTHAILGGSPAFNHGNPAGCQDSADAPLTEDQRGQPRPLDGRCDSGSVEISSAIFNSQIDVDPLAIDFGDISLEVPNIQDVVIANNGAGTLNVTGMSLSDAVNYSVTGGSCGGVSFSLAEGESCTAEVTFMPKAEGSFDAVLTVASNDPINPSVAVALTGVGIDTGDDGGQVPPPAPPASGGCTLSDSGPGQARCWSLLILFGMTGMMFAVKRAGEAREAGARR
jgi:hypothetical protein